MSAPLETPLETIFSQSRQQNTGMMMGGPPWRPTHNYTPIICAAVACHQSVSHRRWTAIANGRLTASQIQ